ncbi:MAG: hypothetical protein LBV23_04390 [Deltaproteobacteria bacterium]|nr:hypothetical protein [Deltaproteobacteria bacterium]
MIAEMEKIRVVTVGKVRLANPVTKTQQTIMGEFGLDEGDLVAYVNNDGLSKIT